MVVVKLMGGLGNQMFQYAFGRDLATRLNKQLVLDLDFLLDRSHKDNFVYRDFDLDLFDLDNYLLFDEKRREKFFKKSFFNKPPFFYKEKSFNYQDYSTVLFSKKIYLDGYWQSFKYFKNIENQLRKEFKFKIPLTQEQFILQEEIQSKKSVCINFRRTDFVTIKTSIHTHGVPTMVYYENALNYLKDKVGNDIELYVFSDDIEWCKQNFHTTFPTFFVGHEKYKGERFSSYLQLIKSCKHFIIPNSTFGWWGAWMGEYKDKVVITPENWFADNNLQSQTQDLRPESWICL
jgi:hypothetical protein